MGFILKNRTYERFEPIGITWNDSYCRKITDTGPSGADFDSQESNCTGTDSTNLLGVKGILQVWDGFLFYYFGCRGGWSCVKGRFVFLISYNLSQFIVCLGWDRFGWFIREIGPSTHFLSR